MRDTWTMSIADESNSAAIFSLVRLDNVPDELWQIAEIYWEQAGLDKRGQVVWQRPVREVGSEGWSGGANVIAGAGGVASLGGSVCRKCGGPLTFSSRTAYTNALAGTSDGCRACTSGFEEKVAAVNHPGARDRYLEHKERVLAQHVASTDRLAAQAFERAKHETIEAARREAIASRYPLVRRDESPSADDLDVRSRIITLTLMHYFSNGCVVGPVETFDEELAPSMVMTRDLIAEVDGKILVRHPSTRTDAFAWDAPAADEDPIFSRYTPSLVSFHLGQGVPDDDAWMHALDDVSSSLDISVLNHNEVEELLALTAEAVAEEGARYLDFKLDEDYQLAPVPDQHRSRVKAMLDAAATSLSLGHIYRAIWTATSAATNLKASRALMSKEKVATFAVNRLEVLLQEYINPDFDRLEPYRSDTRVPLSALTRALFYRVLTANPMSDSVVDLRERFQVPSEELDKSRCRAEIPDGRAVSDALVASSPFWSGVDFRQALAVIEEHSFRVCAPGCAHDRLRFTANRAGTSFDTLEHRIGADAAAFSLIETIPYLNFQIADGRWERPGDLLLHFVSRELGVNVELLET
jgi:hypothetical protein